MGNRDTRGMSDNPYDRPFVVTILGVLYAIAAIVVIFVGVALMAGGESLVDELVKQDSSLDWLQGISLGAGAGILVLGIIYGVICYGFFKGWSIMWYLGIIFTVIGAVISIATIILGGFASIVTLIIDLIILLYLFKPNVKLFFLKHE